MSQCVRLTDLTNSEILNLDGQNIQIVFCPVSIFRKKQIEFICTIVNKFCIAFVDVISRSINNFGRFNYIVIMNLESFQILVTNFCKGSGVRLSSVRFLLKSWFCMLERQCFIYYYKYLSLFVHYSSNYNICKLLAYLVETLSKNFKTWNKYRKYFTL